MFEKILESPTNAKLQLSKGHKHKAESKWMNELQHALLESPDAL